MMDNAQITKILDAHSVPWFIANGRVYADSMIGGTELFEEVEEFAWWTTKRELYQWLGYDFCEV